MSDPKYPPVMLPHLGCVPFDPAAPSYVSWQLYAPHTYTNWRDETMSWKDSCYIAAQLSVFNFNTYKGPDVIRMISDISVNSYANFPVGSAKHMIMCDDSGYIIFDGMVLRLADDEIMIFADAFYIQYRIDTGDYDIAVQHDVPGGNFVFQIAGPRSLETLEHAAKEDLHDVEFMRFRSATIAGHKVRVLRMGMGGSLSYEVHGFGNDVGIDVYSEILRAGEPYGIKKLGINQYMCNHTENGYPQASFHFPGAAHENKGYSEYLAKTMAALGFDIDILVSLGAQPRGTLSNDIRDYYRNPYELGWGHMVKFDHDFTGRAALERIAAKHREMVTLVWNHDDMMKVFASFFEKGAEPYLDMPFPQDVNMLGVAMNKFYDFKVLKDGKQVGVAMGRTYTLYYRETLSLCCIDPAFAEIGTDVTILYGDVDRRPLEIRAKVDRYPYLDLTPNKDYDVAAIPSYVG